MGRLSATIRIDKVNATKSNAKACNIELPYTMQVLAIKRMNRTRKNVQL